MALLGSSAQRQIWAAWAKTTKRPHSLGRNEAQRAPNPSSGTAPGAAAAPRHAAAPHRHAPPDSQCADGRADAPNPDPADGPNTKTDTEPVASTKELDAVADAFPKTDAAAHAQFRADLRAVAGAIPKPIGSPDAAADAHAPDGRAHPEADSREIPVLLQCGRRRGHEDADHVFEFLVCVRLRGRHAAAFV